MNESSNECPPVDSMTTDELNEEVAYLKNRIRSVASFGGVTLWARHIGQPRLNLALAELNQRLTK